MPSTSIHPGEDHRRFWGVIRPVDDPFWDKHRPGDRWNCKCDLSSTDEPVTPVPGTDSPKDMPHRRLDNNPGKDGALINDSHPYFPSDCRHCAFYKPDRRAFLTAFFEDREKDCYQCPYIDGCIDRITAKKEIDEAAREFKDKVIDQNLMPLSGDKTISSLFTGQLHLSGKARKRFLKHAHHDYDVEAAIYAWNNPQELKDPRESLLGEGKNLEDPKVKANIERKKGRHVEKYIEYKLDYKGRKFFVKLEKMDFGKEQFYAIMEQ